MPITDNFIQYIKIGFLSSCVPALSFLYILRCEAHIITCNYTNKYAINKYKLNQSAYMK